MGEFATTVQEYICRELSRRSPSLDWQTEYRIEGTPVDVAGVGPQQLSLVELEWRRADPADNTAKLFRYLAGDAIERQCIQVFQVFTQYYDLERGGYSSKRKNAEFVGEAAATVRSRLSYDPLDLAVDPPKRGGEWPANWERAVDAVVDEIAKQIQ